MLAYFLGSIPFAFLLGRFRGVDLRTVGSGNPGATNLVRACGLPLGVVAFVGDCAKGFVPAFVGTRLEGAAPWLPVLLGAAAIVGHCYTPFLRFQGGKGVATAAGVVGAVRPEFLGILLLSWALTLAVLRNVGIASCLAALVASGLSVYVWVSSPSEWALATFLLLLSLLVVFRHRKNIGSYFRPTEAEASS